MGQILPFLLCQTWATTVRTYTCSKIAAKLEIQLVPYSHNSPGPDPLVLIKTKRIEIRSSAWGDFIFRIIFHYLNLNSCPIRSLTLILPPSSSNKLTRSATTPSILSQNSNKELIVTRLSILCATILLKKSAFMWRPNREAKQFKSLSRSCRYKENHRLWFGHMSCIAPPTRKPTRSATEIQDTRTQT